MARCVRRERTPTQLPRREGESGRSRPLGVDDIGARAVHVKDDHSALDPVTHRRSDADGPRDSGVAGVSRVIISCFWCHPAAFTTFARISTES